MPRFRSAKAVASRVQLGYYKKWHALRGTRMILTIGCLALALGFWVYFSYVARGGPNLLYNPGPVSHAHAMFENNCARCHDADGKGGFFKTVSDTACVTCHSAAVHSPNQVQFVATGPKGQMRSADCTHCHIEHRGEEALKGISDMHCVQCHDNLNAPGRTKSPRMARPERKVDQPVEPRVTGFTLASHPPFGRTLTADQKAFGLPSGGGDASASTELQAIGSRPLVDPTRLKFNHARHFKEKEGLQDCTLCHTTIDPDPRAQPTDKADLPPWTAGKDRSQQWGVLAERAYMLPVSFEKHCQGCHGITVGSAKDRRVLPHDRMAVVVDVLAGIPPEQLSWLGITKPKAKPGGAAAPAAAPAGTGTTPAAPKPSGPRVPRPPRSQANPADGGRTRLVLLAPRPPGSSGSSGSSSPAAPATGGTPAPGGSSTGATAAAPAAPPPYNSQALRKLEGIVNGLSPDDEAKKSWPAAHAADADRVDVIKAEFGRLKASLADVVATDAGPDPSILEFYTAYLATSSCIKCHDLTGSVPAVQKAAAKAPAPETRPSDAVGIDPTAPVPLQTAPTGIPNTPRRWYGASSFDHAGHRNLTCVSCHNAAKTSSATTDMLSPNIVWKTDLGQTASCVDCHHPPTAASRGAGAECRTCHVYHDRSPEGRPDITFPITEVVDWGHKFGPAPAAQHGAAGTGPVKKGGQGEPAAGEPAAPPK